ncbi:MAG: protein translocase subunit SecD [Anaerovoracaceae bacterium]|jgi:SecD/SecF fusion protein
MKNPKANRVLAIVIAVIVVFGWFLMIKGIPGAVKPLKDKINLGLDIKGGVYVVLEAKDTDKYSDEKLSELMEQTKTVVENRVDQLGLTNPNVSVEGKNRIRVELPGVSDANDAIEQIGKTAQLKFTMADQSFVLDGSDVKNAQSGQSSGDSGAGGYVVNLTFNSKGAEAFEKATERAISGQVTPTVASDMCEDGGTVEGDQILIWLDNKVISHPQVHEVISGGKCEISGNFSQEEASNLAALIRGGSLPLELEEIQSSSQTAQIGLDALDASVKAGLLGILIIFVIMAVTYRLMGAVADLALALYIFLILGVMALAGNVLTLPGIAGLILSIGMAVDANVVIFTRIREEIVAGKSLRVATQSGYKRALTTVIDSQVTTLIAAVILYQIGTSSVKGFAWTLMVGTVFSIITAVFVTQIYLNLICVSPRFAKPGFYGIRKNGRPTLEVSRQFKFIKHRKIYYTISLAIIAFGMITLGVRGFNYGIDFTGGTMLQFDTGHHVTQEQVRDVMKRHDVNLKQMQIVYSGDNNEQVLVKTNESLDKEDREAIINDFEKTFHLTDEDVLSSEHFGASVGKELKTNALKAVALAAVGMLIYIRLRFRQWKFGAAALLGVLHDCLIMLSFYAIFQVTVNNPFIAAILTVVGYSINDTIVIFDRVRENLRFMRRGSLENILDVSINQTLSRSIMTSLTTLLVMVPMYILTTSAIREFTLPLMIGVAAGCLSSIFICSPLYYEMAKANSRSKYQQEQERLERRRRRLEQRAAERGEEPPAIEDDEEIDEATGRSLSAPLPYEDERPHTAKEANKGHRKKSRRERKQDRQK